jgi:putative phosphoesterase
VIAIVGDTHLPKGGRVLPTACIERLQAADLILHVGDFIRADVLGQLMTYGEVLAVHGNVDDEALQRRLPVERVVTLADGPRLGMIHDAGPAAGRLARMQRRFPDVDAVLFGHSHLPLHESDAASGFQLFNPGSPTERRRAPHRTMGIATIVRGALRLEHVVLDA